MTASGEVASPRSEPRDLYAVLGADPSASVAELRSAFRSAVLRYHPDRSSAAPLATRRTAILNRAWGILRDPLARLHYDRRLEVGRAETVDWPLEGGEAPAPLTARRRVARAPDAVSRWHQPQWRNVAGFRVPTEIWLQGPVAQRRYIVERHLAGEDWRAHRELYWLRYAAEHYRVRGRTDDWLGALERLVELDPTFDTLARSGLRLAYVEAQAYLRGATFLHRVGSRYAPGSSQRAWIDGEIRAVLAPFRERAVRRGPVAERAEHAELLLNFLEALDLEPTFADYRASIRAHRRAGNRARALELVGRLEVGGALHAAAHWFGLIQLLTELGELDRASELLAGIARGDRPDALDRARLGGDPVRRIAAARTRLARGRARAARAER